MDIQLTPEAEPRRVHADHLKLYHGEVPRVWRECLEEESEEEVSEGSELSESEELGAEEGLPEEQEVEGEGMGVTEEEPPEEASLEGRGRRKRKAPRRLIEEA